VQPLKSGVLKKENVRGDLFELCRGEAKGRSGNLQIELPEGHVVSDLPRSLDALSDQRISWRDKWRVLSRPRHP